MLANYKGGGRALRSPGELLYHSWSARPDWSGGATRQGSSGLKNSNEAVCGPPTNGTTGGRSLGSANATESQMATWYGCMRGGPIEAQHAFAGARPW
mmetsp:Transcript_10406/g.18393  ORF Transcript_10406/g.18393 Transcript_10406/m.18393 type:complete len:97 (+) Transcript_10406:18-308(+)